MVPSYILNKIDVFTKIGHCIMMVQKLESTLAQDSHISKKIKLNGSQSRIILADLYMKKNSDKIISIDPTTLMPLENHTLNNDFKGEEVLLKT